MIVIGVELRKPRLDRMKLRAYAMAAPIADDLNGHGMNLIVLVLVIVFV